MDKKKKYRLTYCDACRPVYDRFDVTAYLKQKAGDLIEFTDGGKTGVLLIQGCDMEICAQRLENETGTVCIRGKRGVEEFIARINKKETEL